MPRGDKTGPMGMGPMTGRGAGYCNGFAVPGYANPTPFAGGYGCGLGRGFGRGNMFRATGMSGWARYGFPAYKGTSEAPFDEKTLLTNQAEFLENQLQQVKKRLYDLNEEAE